MQRREIEKANVARMKRSGIRDVIGDEDPTFCFAACRLQGRGGNHSGLSATTVPPTRRIWDQASKALRGTPDWRMIDCSVPMRSSEWSGTGIVIVGSASLYMMT